MLNFARWKIILIFLVCAMGVLTALPNVFTPQQLENFPDYLPTSQVTLGLDLQGGSHMLLEVDVDSVIAERLDNLQDDVRRTLRQERIGYTGLSKSGQEVTFRLREAGDQDRAMQLLQDLSRPITNANLLVPTRDLEVSALDDQHIRVRLTDQAIIDRRASAVSQSIEVIRRRIDELGTREPTIQRQGLDRILVQVPGLQDSGELRKILETTAKMTFHMVDDSVTQADLAANRVPPGTILRPDRESGAEIPIQRRALLTGENLVDANPTVDQFGGPAVSLRFDNQGARRFGQLTAANVGKRFAIVLDDEIITAPVIRQPILQGTASISGGGMTVEDANALAILLRAGALPAKLTILEERTVGPDLGADSIASGKEAALIGLALVVLFILVTYGFFGVAANVALAFNICLLFGALSFLHATLTLPGIAGIVLTIGMAVDANVLVFERVREELRLGRTPFSAVDTGYSSAMSTILDANITTLIAAVILFQFGSGPIRGFAVTLAIGIVTSVFTAVTLTRFFIATWLKKRRPKTIVV